MADTRAIDDPPDCEALPTHNADGVDIGLIRWMLSLTPAERLQTLENHMRFVAEARLVQRRRPTE